jgi:hypothetical protein
MPGCKELEKILGSSMNWECQNCGKHFDKHSAIGLKCRSNETVFKHIDRKRYLRPINSTKCNIDDQQKSTPVR